MNSINKIGVVGAGQMGRGIAQVAAMNGYETLIFDVSSEFLDIGLEFINKQLTRGLEKNKWDQKFVDNTLSNITGVDQLDGLTDCDLIIEAATENKEIKFNIFRDLDKMAKASALLATNTSSISISQIAAQTSRASQVAGMHFMHPVPTMKLVEGIRGRETSEETFDTIASVAEKMGKIFIKANDVAGFAVNRILMPMINEAIFALHENVANVEDIDQAMKLGCNHPMGPLELADFIGLDTCLSIMEVIHDGLGDAKYRPCPLLKEYVLAGKLGRKSKRGFYEYK